MNIKTKRILIILLAVVFILAGCSNGKALQASETSSEPSVSDSEATPSVSVSPSKTPAEATTPEVSPEPSKQTDETSKYFTDEEKVTEQADKGYWLYTSPTLYVEVKKIVDKENTQTYYAAEIRFKKGEEVVAGFANPKRPGVSGSWKPLYTIARQYKAVIAINSDYMTKDKEKKGIIIRDGKVYNTKEKADTLAFMPDGTLKIFGAGETTISAQKLLDEGVKDTFSFGPALLTDYKLNPNLNKHPLRPKNPRTAIGMIEPYHYILMVVDGRQKDSKGMTLQQLAEVFVKYNCSVAYNLDGGQSSTMSFMGKNINKYAGSTTGQRSVPDALMFGKSEKVPD
jgi:exopolysaccharide biosynthesis protein